MSMCQRACVSINQSNQSIKSINQIKLFFKALFPSPLACDNKTTIKHTHREKQLPAPAHIHTNNHNNHKQSQTITNNHKQSQTINTCVNEHVSMKNHGFRVQYNTHRENQYSTHTAKINTAHTPRKSIQHTPRNAAPAPMNMCQKPVSMKNQGSRVRCNTRPRKSMQHLRSSALICARLP